MRKRILVVDDLQDRSGDQYVVCENSGADQWKIRLALQASLECLEFPVCFTIALCTAALVPAPEQHPALFDAGSIMQIERFEPRSRTEPQEFAHLVAFRRKA